MQPAKYFVKKRLVQWKNQPFCSIIKLPHKMKTTDMNYTPIQLKLPVDLERIIKINDPVYSFSEVMAHIDLKKYFVEKEHETGRPRYDREKLLKIVLFAFMEFGYCSVRFIQKLCETDIRFLWMLEEENAPCHMTISNFIRKELAGSLDAVFNDINSYMFSQLGVDMNHAYIDGTKIEANANKYSWLALYLRFVLPR